MSRPPLRVAMLGAGTVGRAVIDALVEHPERLRPFDGRPLTLAGVAVRRLDRARDDGLDAALLTDAPAHLVADPETDVIVEVMGGDEPARTLIAAALGAGKPVVTANKHVVAHHGPELEADRPAGRDGVPLRGRGRWRHPGPVAAGRRTSPATTSPACAASSTARPTTS